MKEDIAPELQETSTLANNVGWGMMAVIGICLFVNIVYLIPVKMYETFIIGKGGALWIRNIIRKDNKIKTTALGSNKKITPATKIQTESKMIRDTENQYYPSVNDTMDILKKKTQDQTGFLSNMSIGMIKHEETKSPRHGNPSSPKSFMHPSSLDYINIQNDQSLQAKENSLEVIKLKDTLRAQIVKNNFSRAVQNSPMNAFRRATQSPEQREIASFESLRTPSRSNWKYEIRDHTEQSSIEVEPLTAIREGRQTADQDYMNIPKMDLHERIRTSRWEPNSEFNIKENLRRNDEILSTRNQNKRQPSKKSHMDNSLEF